MRQETNGDEEALAKYLGAEVVQALGGREFGKDDPFKLEMSRPLAGSPEWKEYLVIYSDAPDSYVLTKGTQSVRGAEIEGYQMHLRKVGNQWEFTSRTGVENISLGFEIFACLKTANEIVSASKRDEAQKNLLK